MAIINPGSTHFDTGGSDTNALIDYNDYPNGATAVDSLNNDPAAVTTDD